MSMPVEAANRHPDARGCVVVAFPGLGEPEENYDLFPEARRTDVNKRVVKQESMPDRKMRKQITMAGGEMAAGLLRQHEAKQQHDGDEPQRKEGVAEASLLAFVPAFLNPFQGAQSPRQGQGEASLL